MFSSRAAVPPIINILFMRISLFLPPKSISGVFQSWGRNRLRLFNRLRRPAYYVIASATIKLAYPVSQRLHPNGAFQLVRSSDCIRRPGSFFGFLPVSIYYHTPAYLSTTFYNFIITFYPAGCWSHSKQCSAHFSSHFSPRRKGSLSSRLCSAHR